MLHHRAVATTAFLGLSLVLLGPLTSCVEIRITSATVVAGPAAGGALTLQVGATLTLEEGMVSEEDPSMMEPTPNAMGYVVVGLPAKAEVRGARLEGPAAMTGAGGVRVMGEAPQIAGIYESEFATSGIRWVAFHVVLDEVDLRTPQAVSVELDLAGVPTGVHPVHVAAGAIDDLSTVPTAATPTELELAIGADKATVRVLPAQPTAPKGVKA